ncbi:hypothetical protein JJJ17_08440 [Paracoccus caeni]|uniref:Uncharacterized protein n=1 Tax=Paracoccus caeni TaxID=657651 RepID=A0A934SEL3_9RHOB|nr:hypothetical protein [Paracoccus caeni]MBK4215949.1 hypothetical protein [Paracoccus caeni]
MPRNITFVAVAVLPLLLTACGTPQERCISRNTDEYRTISRLLAEVEGNLARGYAWEERQVVRDHLTQCRRVYRDKDGNAHVGYEPCWRDRIETERYRVPIDPAVEERKRANLSQRKEALSGRAAQVVQACKAAYPEEEQG